VSPALILDVARVFIGCGVMHLLAAEER